MMSEKSKLWLEAGKLFSIDTKANALCPECGLSNLESKDILIGNNLQVMERMIYCPKCETKNYIRLKVK